jgi:hypothetical protein
MSPPERLFRLAEDGDFHGLKPLSVTSSALLDKVIPYERIVLNQPY